MASEFAQASEAELFCLFWLQYFGRSITSAALQILWEKSHGGTGETSDSRLPLARLATAGIVKYGTDGKVCLVADRLTANDLRTVWEASEGFDWSIPSEFLSGKWYQKAFKVRHEEWYYGSTSAVDRFRLRHIFYRWGIGAWRAVDSQVADYRYDEELPAPGNDRKLREAVRENARTYRHEGPELHNGPAAYADIVAFPPGMAVPLERAYRAAPKLPLGGSDVSFLREIALSEASKLRAGTSVFEPETEAELLAQVAVDDWLKGKGVGWAIARLNVLRTQVPLSPCVTLLLSALAFWSGDWRTIEDVERESPYCVAHKRSVATALKLAKDGEFAEAEKELSSAIGLMYYSLGDRWHVPDLPILLVLLICKVRSGGGAQAALKRLATVILERCADHYSSHDQALDADLIWVLRFVKLVPGVQAYHSGHDGEPTYLPFAYLRLLTQALEGKADKIDLDDAFERAARAQVAGYPFVAADIVACVRRRTDKGSESTPEPLKRFESLKTDPEAVFAAPRETVRHWERVLEILEKSLPQAVSRAAAKRAVKREKLPDELCWALELSTERGLKVELAFPLLRKRLRDGSLGEPVKVGGKSFIEGKYDGCLRPEDGVVKQSLIAAGCVLREQYAPPESPTLETLRVLSGRDNLYCRVVSYRSYYGERLECDRDLKPLVLTVEPARIGLGYRPDGGIEISLPVSAQETSASCGFVLKRKSGKTETLNVIELTAEYVKTVKALSQVTPDARLAVPAEGAARMEALAAALSDQAPVRWTKASGRQTASAEVPVVPTVAKPLVRLAFADEALTASVVVRLSEEPAWTSEPAKGPPERLTVRKDGTRALLQRDFQAETQSVAAAQQTLAVFSTAQTDDNHWYFAGLEESLDALAALHAAAGEDAFALEWPDGESLKLADVVAQATCVTGGETADYWLEMSGEFRLDDGKVLSFVELLRAFDRREGAYVRLTEGRYLRLTAALARRLEALKGAGIERNGALRISPAAVPALEKVSRETEADGVLPLPEIVKERLETIRRAFARKVRPPDGLKCQMRPYQVEGYEWLSRLESCGIGACLADDMGLGKTVQLIALLLACRAKGPSLVVAPASVAFNWRNEIERFAPTLRVALIGQTPGADEDVAREAKTHDVVITSYGVLTTREEQFAPVSWNVLVLDEAQAIKNHLTKRAKSVKRLKARFRAVATGTPIENRLTELWSLFDFLNPGMLGGETRFNQELAPHGEATPRLKRLVKPLILRRLKRDVLTDLPEKEEITVPVALGDEERHAYEAVRMNALAKLQGEAGESKLEILAELTRLRRFCCHPSLVMPSVQVSAKLEALAELLENLKANNHRALVFSQFVDYLAIVRKMLAERGWTYRYLDGGTSKSDREKGVEAFQAGEGDFFLISLKAGGMGLNLTSANYVILLDPWWNPAVENQAADRVHRIGQHLPVTVYRLIARDTIEEKVVKLHAKKTALAEDVLAEGAAALSAAALLKLLES